MKKKGSEKEANNERWLLTYSDLITLLMIFFVVMYASSSVDANKYKALSTSLNSVFTQGGGKSLIGTDNRPSITDNKKQIDTVIIEKNKMKKIKKEVDQYSNKNFKNNPIKTHIDNRGLVITLDNTLLFDTGRADIKAGSNDKLVQIGKMLNQLNNYIRIEGHTDNIPIKNDRFQSNWQLSCERAANVTMLLIEKAKLSPERLSALGYGECRPIASNTTEAGRAKNRRVDIVIMNSKFNGIENSSKK